MEVRAVVYLVIKRLTLWEGMSKSLNPSLRTLFLLFSSTSMGGLLGYRDKDRISSFRGVLREEGEIEGERDLEGQRQRETETENRCALFFSAYSLPCR